jgi:hypothetical protein
MARIEGDAVDLDAFHPFALPGTDTVSRIYSAARVIRKSSKDLYVVPFGTKPRRQRQALEDRFGLEPLAEKEDPQGLNQTRRFT